MKRKNNQEVANPQRLICFIVLILSLLFTACNGEKGQGNADQNSSVNKNEAEEKDDEKKDQTIGEVDGLTVDELDFICGGWNAVCSTYKYPIEEGKIKEDFSMLEDEKDEEDEEDDVRQVFFYVQDNQLYADYKSSSTTYYKMALEAKKETLYDGFDGKDWCLVGEKGRWEESELRFAWNKDNDLVEYSTGEFDEDGDWEYLVTYLKEGSEKLAHKEDYRYLKTVTVSTVDEFARALKDRTKIILKPGAYDLTELVKEALKPNRAGDYGSVIEYKDNIWIGAESDALTELYVTDVTLPVLSIEGSTNVQLKGLTLGHRVEPGTCSGSVLYVSGTSNIEAEGCHLYGSGSYGLEGYNSSNIYFKDTDIYECTYGIMSLYECHTMNMENCDFYDNHGFEMLDTVYSSSLHFSNCRFKNNGEKKQAFLSMTGCWTIDFENCKFTNNFYKTFFTNAPREDGTVNKEEPDLENCSFDDNRK